MNKVLDSLEYIIEPGTDYEAVMDFFDTVHWSINRIAGLRDAIACSNRSGTRFVVYLKGNVPFCKRLKGVVDGQRNTTED